MGLRSEAPAPGPGLAAKYQVKRRRESDCRTGRGYGPREDAQHTWQSRGREGHKGGRRELPTVNTSEAKLCSYLNVVFFP
jgi:hypothetical protein